MNDLGYTHVGFGEYDKALSYLLPCETYLKEAGDDALMSLSKTASHRPTLAWAVSMKPWQYQIEAVELSRKVDNWYGVASFLGYISTTVCREKRI